MFTSKLTSLTAVRRLAHKNVLSPRSSLYRTAATLLKAKSEKLSAKGGDDDLDKPIKFSSSEASTWNPVYSRTGEQAPDDRPWFQTYVVLASTGIFLIYFCVLREENDIDQKLTLDLSDHFKGEQKRQLIETQQIAINFAKSGVVR